MNIYERLPIHWLQELIGDDRLSNIEGVLTLLKVVDFDPQIIHSRRFLANIARLLLNSSPLDKSATRLAMLKFLPPEVLKQILEITNSSCASEDYESLLQSVHTVLNKKNVRNSILPVLGLDVPAGDSDSPSTSLSSQAIPAAKVPFKQLKGYQFEVFFEAKRLLQASPINRFILQMPTGAGKTRTAMEVVASFLNENPKACVVWVAHSRELCDQAVQCFLELWPHLGSVEIDVHRLYGAHTPYGISTDRPSFVCASFQTLYARINGTENSEDLLSRLPGRRLVVVDEAHKVVAVTYKAVTKSLLGNYVSVMGLTATPGRSYGQLNTNAENEELAKFFFSTIISFNARGEDPIAYLRSIGVLASARMERLAIDGSCILSDDELKHVKNLFDIPPSVLKKLGKDRVRNAEIVSCLVDLIKGRSCKSIIYFATSLEQSVLISSVLKLLDISTAHVDGTTPGSERDQRLREFKEGKLSVLCNYEILSTGFDAPKVDCVFIARPTLSVVLYSQMIGRGLRGPQIGGTANCLIVNVKDNLENLPGIEDMYRVFDSYWVE